MRNLFFLAFLGLAPEINAAEPAEVEYVSLSADEEAFVPDPKDILIKSVSPLYPKRALRDRQIGHVCFLYDIVADGSVSKIRIFKSIPQYVFDEEALRAFKKWKYTPAEGVRADRKFCLFFQP